MVRIFGPFTEFLKVTGKLCNSINLIGVEYEHCFIMIIRLTIIIMIIVITVAYAELNCSVKNYKYFMTHFSF